MRSSYLRSLVARFVAWHAHHHVAGRVSQYELAALAPEHYAEILQLRRQSTDIFRQAVIRGIGEGTFAAVDVHRVVRAILSLGVDLVRWYRTGGPTHPSSSANSTPTWPSALSPVRRTTLQAE